MLVLYQISKDEDEDGELGGGVPQGSALDPVTFSIHFGIDLCLKDI